MREAWCKSGSGAMKRILIRMGVEREVCLV